MSSVVTPKVQKFHKKHDDDYHLWVLRSKIALKDKCYWSKLSAKSCDQESNDKSSAMIVPSLGHGVHGIGSIHREDLLEILSLLDNRLTSKRSAKFHFHPNRFALETVHSWPGHDKIYQLVWDLFRPIGAKRGTIQKSQRYTKHVSCLQVWYHLTWRVLLPPSVLEVLISFP